MGGRGVAEAQLPPPTTERIAVLSAFSSELALLLIDAGCVEYVGGTGLVETGACEVQELGGNKFWSGNLRGNDVVMALTGVSIVVGGNGVSGPTFVDNRCYRMWVWDAFQADALDMETAAVAHVAYVNDVPYIAFRSLSDLAGGGPGENQIGLFFTLAAVNSSNVLLAFLEAWATR